MLDSPDKKTVEKYYSEKLMQISAEAVNDCHPRFYIEIINRMAETLANYYLVVGKLNPEAKVGQIPPFLLDAVKTWRSTEQERMQHISWLLAGACKILAEKVIKLEKQEETDDDIAEVRENTNRYNRDFFEKEKK